MTARATSQLEWVIFLAARVHVGLVSTLHQLAVDLSLACSRWWRCGLLDRALRSCGLVLRLISGHPIPRDRRAYGHLLVMSVINITIPFAAHHLGRAVGRQSSLAAILNVDRSRCSSSCYRADVPAGRADPRQRRRRVSRSGSSASCCIVSRRADGRGRRRCSASVALLGVVAQRTRSAAVYSRRNVRGLPPLIPAVFQVTFAAAHRRRAGRYSSSSRGVCAPVRRVRRPAVVWLGVFGSGLAYLFFFPAAASDWGPTRTSMVAYVLPVVGTPPRRHRPRTRGWIRRPDRDRDGAHRRRHRARQQQALGPAKVDRLGAPRLPRNPAPATGLQGLRPARPKPGARSLAAREALTPTIRRGSRRRRRMPRRA